MASIRSLLVQLDDTSSSLARLRHAVALASRHGSALTAAFVADPPASPMSTVVSDVPGELLARADRAASDRAQADFEALRADTTVPMHWLEPGEAGAVATFVGEAAYADLLVLGKHEPDLHGGPPAGFVETVLLASGRPGLVLPPTWRRVGDTALVGWDASPPAVHALAAAMPWLQGAQRVMVLDGSAAAADATDDRLLRYLNRHGIAAEALQPPQPCDEAGPALLALAERHAVDLLVMGCHGHGRLTELLLGGASRHVLQHCTVPLLMVH
jgi:nucleotide-binding universal stress UspA family protein